VRVVWAAVRPDAVVGVRIARSTSIGLRAASGRDFTDEGLGPGCVDLRSNRGECTRHGVQPFDILHGHLVGFCGGSELVTTPRWDSLDAGEVLFRVCTDVFRRDDDGEV
jgi:hypothetical protein